MSRIPVIMVFDVGKTNKKLLLFDEQYRAVYEESIRLDETKDEDMFPCEDVFALTGWIKNGFQRMMADPRFEVKAVNFSAYGASFVYLDENKKVIAPLYNYLKPFPEKLKKRFYNEYGGENLVARQTASPVLGNLNSGMQLYHLKYEKPEKFQAIKYALHLPQYLSFILSGELYSDITSLGCHTHLWDFEKNNYHQWVSREGIEEKFPPIKESSSIAGYSQEGVPVGVGLHDSSAALIPYLSFINEPFVLLSTGTWSISLNPFDHSPLTDDELRQDCLCYISYEGKPVKASRLFAGYEHEQQIKRLARHFKVDSDYYKTVRPDFNLIENLKPENYLLIGKNNLDEFADYETAYHYLMADIVIRQLKSTNLVLKDQPVKKIFVDGGFSNNKIFLHLFANAYPGMEIYSASLPQASAIGAAMVLHNYWNKQISAGNSIELKVRNVRNT